MVVCFSDIRELRNLSVLHSSSNGLQESWTVQTSLMTERMLHVLTMQVQRPRAVLYERERERESKRCAVLTQVLLLGGLDNAELPAAAPEEVLDIDVLPSKKTNPKKAKDSASEINDPVSSEAQAAQQEASAAQKPAVEPIAIDKGDLKEFVGQPPFTSDRIYDHTPPGVVMGLAWCVLSFITQIVVLGDSASACLLLMYCAFFMRTVLSRHLYCC